MSLTTLPDLCLLRILDYLTLSDLSQLHLIHPRFHSLQAESYARHRHLTLLIGNCSTVDLSDPNAQSLPRKEYVTTEEGIPFEAGIIYLNYSSIYAETASELTAEKVTELRQEYSGIRMRSLEVILNGVSLASIEPHLLDLLTFFSSHLTRLCLYFGAIKCTDSCGDSLAHKLRTFRQLLALLNSKQFPKLKSLTFQYRGLLCDQNNPRIDLPVLTQLEELIFECGENVAKSLDLLNRVRSEALQRIVLGNRTFYKDNIKSYWLEIPAAVGAKFAHLEVYQYEYCHYSLLKSLFDIFYNLESLSLTLSLSSFPMSQLASSLAPLLKLSYLRLTLLSSEYSEEEQNEAVKHELQLSSVKILILTFADTGHHQIFEAFNLPNLFPAVQILKLILTTNCATKSESTCVRELASNFIFKCRQLKRICKRDVVLWEK